MKNFNTLLQGNYDRFIQSLEHDYNNFLLHKKLDDNQNSQIIYLEICLRDYIPQLIDSMTKKINEENKNLRIANENLALALIGNKSGQICKIN